MLRTSEGFHTFTIFRRISSSEAKRLYRDFHRYRNKHKKINIYITNDERRRIDSYKNMGFSFESFTMPRKWRIDYVCDSRNSNDNGIFIDIENGNDTDTGSSNSNNISNDTGNSNVTGNSINNSGSRMGISWILKFCN